MLTISSGSDLPRENTVSSPTIAIHHLKVEDVGAIDVVVGQRGEGHPVVLLHGGAGQQSVDGFADLLADTDHAVTTLYGSLTNYLGTPYAARNTFLIDPSGVIRKVYLKVKPATHSDDLLADLDTLQAKK